MTVPSDPQANGLPRPEAPRTSIDPEWIVPLHTFVRQQNHGGFVPSIAAWAHGYGKLKGDVRPEFDVAANVNAPRDPAGIALERMHRVLRKVDFDFARRHVGHTGINELNLVETLTPRSPV